MFALLLLASLAGLIALSDAARAHADTSQTAIVARLASLENEVLQSYMGKALTDPPRYYSGGQWLTKEGIECWNCYDAAGTAAAVLFDRGIGGSEYERVAVETTNAAIDDHQLSDGSFEGSASASAGLTTGFYGVELGLTYLELRNVLEPATRSRWRAALAAAARYLIDSGQTTWYINGNVNLRQAEVMWLAWQVTGEASFWEQYEDEWSFTLSPPQSRWPGFGLKLTAAPTDESGADGAGYLAESGGGTPGFDPSYTLVQLDTASQMYVLTREPRWLRLVNLLYNQLAPLVSVTAWPRSEWDLDASNGTRKSLVLPFSTPALYVLVVGGQRAELEDRLEGQLATIEHDFRGAMTYTNANMYKALSGELATPMLDEQWPEGAATSGPSSQAVGSACTRCPSAQSDVAVSTAVARRARARARSASCRSSAVALSSSTSRGTRETSPLRCGRSSSRRSAGTASPRSREANSRTRPLRR